MHLSFLIFLIIYLAAITWEVFYDRRHKLNLYSLKDSAVNFSLGLLVVAVRIVSQGTWVAVWTGMSHFAIFKIEESVFSYILLFLIHEFIFYWVHRCSHNFRPLWAIHVNHHSSKMLNLTTAARMPLFMFVVIFIFWSPLILIGFDPYMLFVVTNISFLLGVFQHSHTIGSLGVVVEYIFVTPTHHRIHHASNPEYINHNFGSTLIIFDRLFGSFKKPDPSVQITYGITKDLKTYNPIKIIFHEWIDLLSGR